MDLKNMIVVGISGVVFVFMVVWLYIINPKTKKQKIYETALQNNWCTEGHQVKIVYKHGRLSESHAMARNMTYTITYEYQVGGGTYYKKITFNSNGRISFYAPNTIKLYYLQDNPGRAVAEAEIPPNRGALGCFVCLGTSVIVLVILIQLFGIVAK